MKSCGGVMLVVKNIVVDKVEMGESMAEHQHQEAINDLQKKTILYWDMSHQR